jgi:hypothetical protein
MMEEGLLSGERTWFFDPRTPLRRMGVASHPEQGVVVLSLWTGDTCTATFRLPMADAARLISSLANGLAAGLPLAPVPLVEPARRGWRAWVARIRRRPKLAEVVHLRAAK